MLDLNSEFGKRTLRRLSNEQVIWLTTVGSDGTPQPRPVWFFWTGEKFLIYSEPNTQKLRHVARNPKVSLHFDGDGKGGDIVIFTGEARISPDTPPAGEVAEYIEKYRQGLERINMTPEQFSNAYSIAVVVEVAKVRGH